MNKPRPNQYSFRPVDQQLENSPEFNQAIDRDFGTATESHDDGFSRRRWLQLMGASLALGGLSGCRYEEEKIAPFAFRPHDRLPGVPQKFATMTELGGVAVPLISTNYDGRPIKLDGNPKHPDSMGASSAFSQARILEFYDPDRIRMPMVANSLDQMKTRPKFMDTTWDELIAGCKLPSDLSKVAILSEPTASPSLLRLQREFTGKGGKWFSFAAISDDNTRAGSKQAFGTPVRAHYKFDEAAVIVTLDADPLLMDQGSIANSISFAKSRDAESGKMSRMYSVESQYTTTGAAADHRISVPSSKIAGFAAALAAAIDGAGEVDQSLPYRERVLAAMASDLAANKGKSIIIAGEKQPPQVHALVHALNQKLGNNGSTITFTNLPDPERAPTLEAIKELAAALQGGSIEKLIILGGNPVQDAPGELKLGELIAKADALHVTSFKNETSNVCSYVSNAAHPLASWKDGFSYDGSVLVGQPLINPLFGGKSEIETLATLLGMEVTDGQAIVQETLQLKGAAWKQAVHDGFVEGTLGGEAATVSAGAAPSIEADDSWSKPWDGESFEVVFAPSNSLYDGRFANNAWLQELPDLFTKVAWDNVASVSPRTAKAMGVTQLGMSGKSRTTMMTITLNGETIKIPIAVQPGQADGTIALEIGYGRTSAGRVGGEASLGVDPVGFDVNPIRSSDNWLVSPIEKSKANGSSTLYKLALVQEPWTIDKTGRDEIQARMFRDASKSESDRSSLIREGSFKSYKAFMSHHPVSHDAHDSHDGHGHGSARIPTGQAGPKRSYALGSNGQLPIINQVSYIQETHDHEEHGEHGHGDGHDDHGHGHHKPQWPEAFHSHHALFDLTPGSREDYKNVKQDGQPTSYVNTWGMSIDLNKCIGCNSCVVSCQAENNVPIVGKDEVWRGREMHWIRIDRYYGDNLYTDDAADDDEILIQQPVACHHCENAPCETVCPVAATVHSHEGLNDMVYNRCIGTRYCGNNCPYKVRRFNYLNYSDAVTLLKYPGADKLPAGDRQLQNLMMNPEVTIRSRGVMEKCTYCTQRISNTKILAKVEDREIGANEITTACQDACPTQAIKFGDLHNPESDVAKAHASPRAYAMLKDLNNRPRTKYLARVRNPHEALIDRDDSNSVSGHGVPEKEHGNHDSTHAEHPEKSHSEAQHSAAADDHTTEVHTEPATKDH